VAEVRGSLVDARKELETALAAGRSVIGAGTTAPGPVGRPRPSRPILTASVLDAADADSLRRIIGRQQRALDSLDAWWDSIEAHLVVARDTLARVIMAAARYRLYADSMIGAQARQITAMRVVIATPKPRRRWGVGGAAGYCAVYESGDGHARPGRPESLRLGAGVCGGWSFNF
jgi:hypothetical protein